MRRQAGFTLLEILISTSLFAVVMAALVGVYIVNLRMGVKTGSRSQTLDMGQHAIALLEKDVDVAAGAWSPTSYGASSSALGLYMPRFDSTGLLIATDDEIVYYLSGNSLRRDVIPASGSTRTAIHGQLILASATGSPIFSYYAWQDGALQPVQTISDTQVVRVELETWGTDTSDSLQQWFHGDYRLRNKR